jgi:hypothetical protein
MIWFPHNICVIGPIESQANNFHNNKDLIQVFIIIITEPLAFYYP